MTKTTEILWVYEAPYTVTIEDTGTAYFIEIRLLDSEFKFTAADQPMYWTFPKEIVDDELDGPLEQAKALIEFWTPARRYVAAMENAA